MELSILSAFYEISGVSWSGLAVLFALPHRVLLWRYLVFNGLVICCSVGGFCVGYDPVNVTRRMVFQPKNTVISFGSSSDLSVSLMASFKELLHPVLPFSGAIQCA